ncbi:MAG: chromate reductase [Polaribacter sp.]|jgi:chromate reductase
MNVLAFAASSSKKSINKQLVTYAAGLVDIPNGGNVNVEVLDLNDYELPLFSEDKEVEIGQPALAQLFLDKIAASDALMISFAEHNGSYSAAYKNLFDWASRVNPKVFQNKPMVMLATSPGPSGGSNVLAAATTSAPFFKGDLKGSLSVPSFYDNFDVESARITNDEIQHQLVTIVSSLAAQ